MRDVWRGLWACDVLLSQPFTSHHGQRFIQRLSEPSCWQVINLHVGHVESLRYSEGGGSSAALCPPFGGVSMSFGAEDLVIYQISDSSDPRAWASVSSPCTSDCSPGRWEQKQILPGKVASTRGCNQVIGAKTENKASCSKRVLAIIVIIPAAVLCAATVRMFQFLGAFWSPLERWGSSIFLPSPHTICSTQNKGWQFRAI